MVEANLLCKKIKRNNPKAATHWEGRKHFAVFKSQLKSHATTKKALSSRRTCLCRPPFPRASSPLRARYVHILYIQTLYTLMKTTRLTAGLQKPERESSGTQNGGSGGRGRWGWGGGREPRKTRRRPAGVYAKGDISLSLSC